MKRVSSREFKQTFHMISEPVEILRWTKTVGFYFPGDENPIVKIYSPEADLPRVRPTQPVSGRDIGG